MSYPYFLDFQFLIKISYERTTLSQNDLLGIIMHFSETLPSEFIGST